MTPKTITQKTIINASPEEVYATLMTSKGHAAFTGEEATISPDIGGSFSAYANYITGRNIDLKPGRLIVQEWVAADWPDGSTSQVTFSLKPVDGGKKTEIAFTHTGVPSAFAKDIAQGWIDWYWEPMKKYFPAIAAPKKSAVPPAKKSPVKKAPPKKKPASKKRK